MSNDQPTGKARREFIEKSVPVGPVVPLPKLGGGHEGAPLTPEAKANLAKLRTKLRAYFPGLRQG
jgi:hypothetical protein